MNPAENPFTQLLVSTGPEGFFGRSAVVSAILHGISAQTPRSFSISGVKTIGKSNLARYLCHPEGALRQYAADLEHYRAEQLIPVYIDCYGMDGKAVLQALPVLLQQDARIKPLISGIETAAPPDETPRERLKSICDALKDSNFRLVLVLDHFDAAYKSFIYEDEIFLRSLATTHALVLLTEKKLSSLYSDSDPQRYSPLQNILIKRPIGMLSDREARQFIQAPLPAGFEFSSSEISFLLEAAGGHTSLLNLACEHLFNLRQEYPGLGMLLTNPEIKSSILAQLSGLPAVKDTLHVLWNHVDDSGQQALLHAAHTRSMAGVPDDVLQELVQTGLLSYRLDEQRYRVFCELFRMFIAAQQPSTSPPELEEILPGLTPRDRQLLEYMASRPGMLVTFEELKSQVWGGEETSKRAVEAAIHRVRQALASTPFGDGLLQNERGKGYRFIPEG